MKQKPEELSEAGFFYTKIADRVVCFNCGLGLRAWEDDDEPWEQHIIFSPNCEYVQLVIGREYVAEMKTKVLKKWEEKIFYEALGIDSPEPSTSSEPRVSPVNFVEKNCGKCAEMLREQRLCKICCTNEFNIVFIPCGHSLSCVKCALALTECPTCRNAFTRIVRVYFS